MSLRAIQQSIAQWGRETFGHPGEVPPPLPIATRMNVEVAELLNGLAELDKVPLLTREHETMTASVAAECADVAIMLVQVADALGVDLEEEIAAKMQINRARAWARGANGKVQHVEGT